MDGQKRNEYQRSVASIAAELSKYSKASILNTSLTKLEETAAEGHLQSKTMSHIIFLILKWAASGQIHGTQIITTRELEKLANRVFLLQSLASEFESSGSLELKLRPMIKQQFATQIADKEELLALVRQLFWFSNGENDYYNKKFKAATGLDLKSFFFIAGYFSLYAFENKDKDLLKFDVGVLMHKLTPHVSISNLVDFLKLVGISVDGMHEFLAPLCFKDYPTWEYYQETPFIKKPIILHGNFVFVMNKKLWNRSMSYFVSDLLKAHFGREFKEHFGETFERYVESVIVKMQLPYLTEEQIKSRYLNKQKYQKVVDFVVEDDCRIFIDAKAIEPNDYVSTCMDRDGLSERLKGSFISAIWQGQECCFNVRQWDGVEAKENFLIVVIHQEHFLNNAVRVEKLLVPTLTEEIENQFGDIPIKLENIYYITIYDLERLVQYVSDSGLSLSEFLINCRNLDSNFETSAMLFRMHLDCLSSSFNDRELVDFTQDCLHNFHQFISKNIQFWEGKVEQYVQARAHFLRALRT